MFKANLDLLKKGNQLTPTDLSRKYSLFVAPKNQILLNNENLQQKYCIVAETLNVELVAGIKSKFSFTASDPESKWVNTVLFEPSKPLEIQMGYGNTLETVFLGEIKVVKTIFSSNGTPKIEVFGEGKSSDATVTSTGKFGLDYGKTLLNFTATQTSENQATKTLTASKLLVSSGDNLTCVAECIGLPDIKPGVVLGLAGLAGKFNLNYQVEKTVHKWDTIIGYRTCFEAKVLPKTATVFRPNI